MKIALLGMGTIGSGVCEMADASPSLEMKWILEKRFTGERITDSMDTILQDKEIALVVETMGGLHPAYEFASQALQSGKHFVTANKLLVCNYGAELEKIAREKGVAFLYSAACGGGIPFLSNMAWARGTDSIQALGGILNGTTNFILDSMETEGVSYDAALKTAQELGYAERDPSSDVDGLDTMRKLVLGCAVGLNAAVSSDDIPVRGISAVSALDIAYAKEHGWALRLCAFGAKREKGISAYVEPTCVSLHSFEAAIHKNVNFTWYEGKDSGVMRFSGQGAGKLPTASNVLRDIQAVQSGLYYMTDTACAPADLDAAAAHSYYIRLPQGAAIPAEWVAKSETRDGFQLVQTVSLPVVKVHAYFAQQPQVFLAGLQA